MRQTESIETFTIYFSTFVPILKGPGPEIFAYLPPNRTTVRQLSTRFASSCSLIWRVGLVSPTPGFLERGQTFEARCLSKWHPIGE